MSITVKCPICGEIYEDIDDTWQNQLVHCEHCGKEFKAHSVREEQLIAEELWEDVLINHDHLIDFYKKIRPFLVSDSNIRTRLFNLWSLQFFKDHSSNFDFHLCLFHGLEFTYDMFSTTDKVRFYDIGIEKIRSILNYNIRNASNIAIQIAPIAAALRLDLATQTLLIIEAIEKKSSSLSQQNIIELLNICEEFTPVNKLDKQIYNRAVLLGRKTEQAIIITSVSNGEIPRTPYSETSIPVMLASDEYPIWCWLNETVEARETKMVRQQTKHYGSYGGGSIRLGKGISVHGGSMSGSTSAPKYEAQDVRIGFGDFIITNKNLFFISDDGQSIKMPIKKITSISKIENNTVAITQSNARMAKPISFTFYIDDSFNTDDTAAWFVEELVKTLYALQ